MPYLTAFAVQQSLLHAALTTIIKCHLGRQLCRALCVVSTQQMQSQAYASVTC